VLFPLSPHRESGTSPFPLAVPYRAPPCPLMGFFQVPPSGVMVTARVSEGLPKSNPGVVPRFIFIDSMQDLLDRP